MKRDFPDDSPEKNKRVKFTPVIDDDPSLDSMEAFISVWEDINLLLDSRFDKIFDTNTGIHVSEPIYQDVYHQIYSYCSASSDISYPALLYDHFTRYIVSILDDFKKELDLITCGEYSSFLKNLIQFWFQFSTFCKFCAKLLNYLDRYYVKDNDKEPIIEKCTRLYFEHVFNPIALSVTTAVIRLVNEDRRDQMTNHRLNTQDVVMLFHVMSSISNNLHYFEETFEIPFNLETQTFFAQLSNDLMSEVTLLEYFKMVDIKISHEESLLSTIFSKVPRETSIISISELIINKIYLLEENESFIEKLIDNSTNVELNVVYRFSRRYPDPLLKLLREMVSRTGREILAKEMEESKAIVEYGLFIRHQLTHLVPKLLEFHKKMNFILENAMENNLLFFKSLNEAFKTFSNDILKRDNLEIRVPQLFAYYCDSIIKSKNSQIGDQIDAIVNYIGFFIEKDIFMEHYKNQLAKRLLAIGTNMTIETDMVSKLKKNGTLDIYKVERMIKDVVNQQSKADFIEYCSVEKLEPKFDLNVLTLTLGVWPLNFGDRDGLIVPIQLLDAQKGFEKFFDSKFSKRVLKWMYQHSTIQIEGRLETCEKLFECTTHQGSVLLLFNDCDVISIKDILKVLNITEEVWKPILGSLKASRLITQPNMEEIQLNSSFDQKFYKIKLPLPRITEAEIIKTQHVVDLDRKMMLEATIVRIMKARKSMNNLELFKTVTDQLTQFKPDISNFQARITSLVEKEILILKDNNVEYLA
jgi:cullin 1